jgi:hypothetical protein
VSPLDLLDPRHAPIVRAAAARWLRAQPDGGAIDARTRDARLDRCVREELFDRVRAMCTSTHVSEDAGARSSASGPGVDPPVHDVIALSPSTREPLGNRLVALTFTDGTALVLHTDPAGRIRIEHHPGGALVLEDPLTTPLDP